MRMEVRCCCQPQKLLGTIEVPSHTEPDTLVTWPLRTLIDAHTDWFEREGVPVSIPFEHLALWCKVYKPKGTGGYPAIKAEHVPLDVLRRVPSFEEAAGWHNLPKELTLDESTPIQKPEVRYLK